MRKNESTEQQLEIMTLCWEKNNWGSHKISQPSKTNSFIKWKLQFDFTMLKFF